MQFKERTVTQLAHMICGNGDEQTSHFVYRSSMYLTEFFRDCGMDYVHTGQTRHIWVADRLREILATPVSGSHAVPSGFSAVIAVLMDQEDARNEASDRQKALQAVNDTLKREGFAVFYAEDGRCYLRHLSTRTVSALDANPHRPMSKEEIEQRRQLEAFLERCSEDELIEEVLLPLFRQLGFQRISPAGHVDKALEYGKDVWMKYRLPTLNWLYFGIQTKRGKLDSAGVSKGGNVNIAEILNQARMMLGHAIFDPEINRKVLIDHAFIVAGGEITKAARNWLGEKLDATQRSQVMFLERKDILDLYIVNRVALPTKAIPERQRVLNYEIPF